MTTYLWTPPPVASLAVQGNAARLPVNRLFFVGRNYHAHAREMGVTIDKTTARPFYFTKSPAHLLASGAVLPYPPQTQDFHHEVELVAVLGRGGFGVTAEQAHELIYGYAVGLDMTRRDVQQRLRDKGHPWCLGKDVEGSAVCGAVRPMPGTVLTGGEIALEVNGTVRQRADLRDLIWNLRELIADLSQFYHLQPGDVIYTGTPEGVGPVQPGDRLHGRVQGVGEVALTLGPVRQPAGVDPALREASTVLPGRLAALDYLGRVLSLAERRGSTVTVMVVAIDDVAGDRAHDATDAERLIAQRLAPRLRTHELLAHWEPGQFLVVLPDADTASALVLASDLRQSAVTAEPMGASSAPRSVSIGLHSRRPTPDQDLRELAAEMVVAAQRVLEVTQANGPGRIEIEP
jgi:fumarylpyruvate hydrolase